MELPFLGTFGSKVLRRYDQSMKGELKPRRRRLCLILRGVRACGASCPKVRTGQNGGERCEEAVVPFRFLRVAVPGEYSLAQLLVRLHW